MGRYVDGACDDDDDVRFFISFFPFRVNVVRRHYVTAVSSFARSFVEIVDVIDY